MLMRLRLSDVVGLSMAQTPLKALLGLRLSEVKLANNTMLPGPTTSESLSLISNGVCAMLSCGYCEVCFKGSASSRGVGLSFKV
jgi:hypothetical protein